MKIFFSGLMILLMLVPGLSAVSKEKAGQKEKTGQTDLSYRSEITYFNKTKKMELKTTSWIWTSGQKVKVKTRVGANSLITITDGDCVYQLDTLKKIVYQQKITADLKKLGQTGSWDYGEAVKNKFFNMMAAEKINGRLCLVYVFNDRSSGTTEKVWFWEEKKIPLKIETENSLEKMTIINRDFSFKPLASSVFEIPRDYQLKELN